MIKLPKSIRSVAFTVAAMVALLRAETAFGAAQPLETFIDSAKAGPDFAVQGEYEGVAVSPLGAKQKIGVQVIALGDHQFRAVFLDGGLPGAGWNGRDKIEVDGATFGGETCFNGKPGVSYMATISGGTMSGFTDKLWEFKLKKTTRHSPTEGAKPPKEALVLYDGTSTNAWQNPHLDKRNLIAAGTKTVKTFKNYTLHAEFILPFVPKGRGQARGNSGVYMQDRYEVQVLDSFGLKGLNNECAGIYSQIAPSMNMCYPPLTWQTYDIDFQMARFDTSGKKVKDAVISVRHNGITVHDKTAIAKPTGGGKPEDPTGGPIQLQGHGNPVYFRNIWIVEKQ